MVLFTSYVATGEILGEWEKLLDGMKMDEYIIKLIVGHSIQDITEKVYTHRTIEQLKEEIEKIQ